MTEYDEIIIVMDNVSTKKTNTIPAKKKNTVAINVTTLLQEIVIVKK